MGKKYTKDEILKKCRDAIDKGKIAEFYNQPFVNYTGRTTTGEYYSEVIAEYLLNNLGIFDSIKTITRENYKVEGHDGEYNPKTNRLEEKIAMDMFLLCNEEQRSFENIGKIIDYQVPLKDKQSDKAGKIDLLSKAKNTLYILELKEPRSKETMLRCILESYTYYKIVNHENLIKSYGDRRVKYVKPAPFVYYKGYQWDEMQQDRPCLNRLMDELGVEGPFYYRILETRLRYKI